MYQIVYRCNYRDQWYDDVPPFGDINSALQKCNEIASSRRCLAQIYDQYGQQVYEADARHGLFNSL